MVATAWEFLDRCDLEDFVVFNLNQLVCDPGPYPLDLIRASAGSFNDTEPYEVYVGTARAETTGKSAGSDHAVVLLPTTVSGVNDPVETIPPADAVEMTAFPLPFNPQVTLSFMQPITSHACLQIFGLNGRKVATLVNEVLNPGEHTFTWSGGNDAGKPMSSGVYLARLEAAGQVSTRKLVLAK
jgi:hypothetical protein